MSPLYFSLMASSATNQLAPLQINSNCTQVFVNIPVKTTTSPEYTLEITYGSNTTTVENLSASNGSIVYVANIETSGVVIAKVLGGDTVMEQAVAVSTCQIDCCIAKLVESAINCTCKCDKCKEELDRAEKIFLLLQSAVYAAEVAENIEDAQAKYAKANELCTEVCACGC